MKVTFEIIDRIYSDPERCHVQLVIDNLVLFGAMVFNNESDAVKAIGEIIQCIEQGDYQVIGQAEKV